MEEDRTEQSSDSGALEVVAVIVLSITTVVTAWTGFQASKWGGEMSIAFSEASSARIEAARQDGTANERLAAQVGLWTQWVSARGDQNTELAEFLEARFPEPLATAQREWLATEPLSNPDAPDSPFQMPAYVLEERQTALRADERADTRFADALANNQRSDNYTLLTVLFASVLFFTAISQRVRRDRSQRLLLGVAVMLGLVGIGLGISFPTTI